MLIIADFILDSDLCLKSDEGPFMLNGSDKNSKLVISNAGKIDAPPTEGVLSAQLFFEADSLDQEIRDAALDRLVDYLNVLTFTTNHKFKYRFLKRIIDWTPGLAQRKALIYFEKPVWSEAHPSLTKDFISTAERLLAMQSGEEQRRAMRWYRLAVETENPDEQFSYFWFALEIVAQATKSSEKIASKCPVCQEPLFCEKCGKSPMHKPFQTDAIRQLIERVHPDNSIEVAETLLSIRHTLMHGNRISSVINDLPCTDMQAINKLGMITWRAISSMFSKNDPRPAEALSFGLPMNLVRESLVIEQEVFAEIPGDPNNPKISDFPNFNISVKTMEGTAQAAKSS